MTKKKLKRPTVLFEVTISEEALSDEEYGEANRLLPKDAFKAFLVMVAVNMYPWDALDLKTSVKLPGHMLDKKWHGVK